MAPRYCRGKAQYRGACAAARGARLPEQEATPDTLHEPQQSIVPTTPDDDHTEWALQPGESVDPIKPFTMEAITKAASVAADTVDKNKFKVAMGGAAAAGCVAGGGITSLACLKLGIPAAVNAGAMVAGYNAYEWTDRKVKQTQIEAERLAAIPAELGRKFSKEMGDALENLKKQIRESVGSFGTGVTEKFTTGVEGITASVLKGVEELKESLGGGGGAGAAGAEIGKGISSGLEQIAVAVMVVGGSYIVYKALT